MSNYIQVILGGLEKKEVVKVTALKEGVNLDTSSALAAKVISVVEVAKRQSSDVYQYTRLVEHQEVRLNLSASDIINGKSQTSIPPPTIEVILSKQALDIDSDYVLVAYLA
ncbi:hypothetical protein E3P92_00443 [Wallemia ichthyophaga]|uniref:Uncharacterized protein n=2 Tax=Wallemia ichthyophaga TaxID=245174 RepID=A0A4T0GSV6_WALIC|nr:uncharacterized protein J056_004229 [Wallemia ichthyophaga EXF-994]TIA73219.1 hypothetical protein E3P91_01539 [Wallemia ichthyophaga]EOR01443.1 hypothetical protein J056_004229 [Wallemia ichthyophaga EXF-994]TIA82158.1 hypothetical protein E3P98_01548 [Wallemia ichthyophaga]TIB03426.1 hypothetical protein E3P95_00624 [Wallemia ichthyophaga]TIB04177.1 hypothetical protein E3P94_00649 [Wallemia ichthyophaga]